MTKRPRLKIDPTKIKKHSDLIKEHTIKPLVIAGERVALKYGVRVAGTKCKDFETYYELIAAGQRTDRVVHEKKNRVYRVLAGQGTMTLFKDGQSRTVTMLAGDEIVASPGISYLITAYPKVQLELLVTQAYKYESSLVVEEESPSEVMFLGDELNPITREEAIQENIIAPTTRRPRYMQKAHLQQAALKGYSPAVPVQAEAYGAGAIVNVKPSMGNLDLEGAG